MFVRLTYLNVFPDRIDEMKKVYTEEVVPVVREQKGNISCHLLEPASTGEEFISMTEWESAADAEAYESSGTYRRLVEKVREAYRSRPILKTYHVVGSKMIVTM